MSNTNGPVQTQAAAAEVIEFECCINIEKGLDNTMTVEKISVDTYSDTSALVLLDWTCLPQPGSRIEGRA